MFRRCRHAAHDHPWAVVALNEWQRCADELLGKHRARPTAIRLSADGPPTMQIRAARGGATAYMWPCGPARAFRPGARPVHGAARPPTAGKLKTDRIRCKSGRRVRKTRSRCWVARGVEGMGAGRARIRAAGAGVGLAAWRTNRVGVRSGFTRVGEGGHLLCDENFSIY